MNVLLVSTIIVADGVLFFLLSKKLDKIGNNMASRDDVQAVTAQLGKAAGEINSKLADLENKINDGTVSAEDLAPLKAAAQALDDIVPDAAPEVPVDPEAPVEQ